MSREQEYENYRESFFTICSNNIINNSEGWTCNRTDCPCFWYEEVDD